MGLYSIDNHSPLAISVDSPQWLDVGGFRWTEVSLLHNLLQSVHTVLGVCFHILVDSLYSFIVVLKSVLNLIGRVLLVLQAPGLGVVYGASGGLIFRLRFMVWSRLMVGRGWLMINWGRFVVNWSRLVVNWSGLVIGWGSRGMVGNWCSMVNKGSYRLLMVNRSCWGRAIWGRGNGVAIYRGVCLCLTRYMADSH